jgi:hypothetical protein
MSQQIHLITYGDNNFTNAKKRINNEGINSEWFDTIEIYSPDILNDTFKMKFKDILKQPRIAGYGLWRPYIIKKKLNEINDNDILIYLDAGCSININGKQRFNEYIEMLNKSDKGIISFQMPHIEKKYTIKEVFHYFNININSEYANSGQILDGILIMKKNKNLNIIIDAWYNVMYDEPLLFTDHYNKNQEPHFIDNRHEQSILSLVRKKHGSIILSDETWFTPFGNKESLKFPFWATRKK